MNATTAKLDGLVDAVGGRMRKRLLLESLALFLLPACAAGAGLAALSRFFDAGWIHVLAFGLLLAAVLAALARAFSAGIGPLKCALAADEALQTHELFSTALECRAASAANPFFQAVVERAETAARAADAVKIVPIRLPKALRYSGAACCAALILIALPRYRTEAAVREERLNSVLADESRMMARAAADTRQFSPAGRLPEDIIRRMELISRMHAQSGRPEDILDEIAKTAGQCAKERENAAASQRILREVGSELGGQVKGSASAAELAELMGQLQKALEEDRLDRGALERALRNARQDMSDEEAAAKLDELLNVLSKEDFKGFAERLGSLLQDNLRDMAALDAIQGRLAASEDAIAKALGEDRGPDIREAPGAADDFPRQGSGGGGGTDLFPDRIPDAAGTGIREPGNPAPIPDMSAEEIARQREQIMKQQAWPTDYDEAIKVYFSGK